MRRHEHDIRSFVRTNFPPKFIQFCNIVQIGEAQSDSGGRPGREGELNGAPGDLAKSLRARVCLSGWRWNAEWEKKRRNEAATTNRVCSAVQCNAQC